MVDDRAVDINFEVRDAVSVSLSTTLRGKEFKGVVDNTIESNIIFESSLQLEENGESCLLSFLIKMQSNVFVHSVNMTISPFLPVNFEQV